MTSAAQYGSVGRAHELTNERPQSWNDIKINQMRWQAVLREPNGDGGFTTSSGVRAHVPGLSRGLGESFHWQVPSTPPGLLQHPRATTEVNSILSLTSQTFVKQGERFCAHLMLVFA